MLIRCVMIGAVSVILLTMLRPEIEAAAPAETSRLIYTVAPTYEALAWMRGGERFPSGASLMLREGESQRALVPAFATSADATVSFDGQRVLFAGKQRSGDHWQIWEMPLDSGEPRRVTTSEEDCIRPLYLPEDRVVYACKTDGRFVIEAQELPRGKALALTYGEENALPSDVLHDGRILFGSAYRAGSQASSQVTTQATPEIYTVYSDGSGVESYRCDHGKARHGGRQVSSGDIVFAAGAGLAKFTSARAQQVAIDVPAGEYDGEVAEIASGEWLVSWRASAKDPFELKRWAPGAGTLRTELKQDHVNLLQPVVVAEKTVPNRHPSGLHDWPNANLLCLNAYTSKYKFSAESIGAVRMYTRDGSGAAKLLGTAPVEKDGSFFVQVPGDRPVQMELLDAAGKSLKRESGYFWLRRGEQRVCVGCHAGPETSPENAVPMTLLKSTTPADLTGTTTMNAAGGH